MRDRFKTGNKDRRNQPPGGTPEVCAFPPTSQSEVNPVCHCNHSILQSVGIVKKKKKKRPKRTIRSAVSTDVPLPIAANQKRNM